MANKALAKRQKMTIRVVPSPGSPKPRNPFAAAAKQRAAGPHHKNKSADHQAHKGPLIKKLADPSNN